MRFQFFVLTLLAAAILISAFSETSLADVQVQTLYDRVEMATFQSTVLGKTKSFCVTLPEDYDPARGNWPVLVLLHGRSGTERTAVDKEVNRESLLSGNFITIMPDGDDSWYINSYYGNYETYLEEVIEVAETQYGLSTDADRRALSGFSMGGYGSVRFAQNHPEDFSVISPIIGVVDYPKNPNEFPPGQGYPIQHVFPTDPALWPDYNPINFVENIADMSIQLITGTNAFDRTMNVNFSARLNELNIGHEFTLLAGGHDEVTADPALDLVVSHINEVFSVPEPGSELLIVAGVIALGCFWRRTQQAQDSLTHRSTSDDPRR